MKLLSTFILVALFVALGFAAGPVTDIPATKKVTTPNPTTPKPTTPKPTTPKPTTPKPTTAKPTTVAPTMAKPTTAKPTTAAPTTAAPTTAKPTTAKPTTAAPTTAKPTTAKPTTAAPPTTNPTTATPAVAPAHWSVKENGSFCLLADFNVTFTGQYEIKDKKMKMFSYFLPQNAQVDQLESNCGTSKSTDAAATNAVLFLTIGDGTFMQEFQADTKTKTFKLVKAIANLTQTGAHFPGTVNPGKMFTYGGDVSKPPFETKLGYYYKCSALEKVEFKDKFSLLYTDLRIQPFDVDKVYGKMSQCKADTPNIIPAEPPVGNWTISNKDGKCMLMSFGADFIIPYTMENKKQGKVGYYLPNNTLDISASSCDSKSATFKASFSPEKKKSINDWAMTMTFDMGKDKSYTMSNFSLEYMLDSTYFPGVKKGTEKKMTVSSDKSRFGASSGSYYMCNADQEFGASKVNVTFTKMKIQPFAQAVKGGGLGTASDCSADSVSNIVPIAVGCALAGLVIIVLIAYLIGRSRTNRSGYQSV